MASKGGGTARRTTAAPPERLPERLIDGEELLLDAMFGAPTTRRARPAPPPPRPEHYKIVSISLYREDIERLETLVQELKRRGHYRANKSQIIRHALAQIDLDRVPNAR